MTLFILATPAVPTADKTAAGMSLATRHKPVLHIDLREPAAPLSMGFTIVDAPQKSPSSKFDLTPPEGGVVIEYAIWHDWDIGHLYDLEHVWVHVDAQGDVVRVEGTMHGLRVCTDTGNGLPELRDGRPVLYCEPGKHAIWAQPSAMRFVAGDMIVKACGAQGRMQGIHDGNMFADAGAFSFSPLQNRLANLALKRAAFAPSFNFVPAPEPSLVSWQALHDWIPTRVQALIDALARKVPHLKAVFLDCGDTLVDETTEEKRPGTEVVLRAEEIPHAMDAVRALHALGYPLSLVADGPRETFENLLKHRGIWALMDAHIISGDIGELKPSPKMFAAAMSALGLGDDDRAKVVMVGNNLARDIRGANRFGLKSLFVSWSKKRTHAPEGPDDIAHASIATLDKLVEAIEAFELALPTEAFDG